MGNKLPILVTEEQMKPTEKTKSFWLMLYAIDSFKKVVWACDYILEHKPHASELIFQCLMTSILTNYGRLFHKNTGVGNLNLDIVPNEHRYLHGQLIQERDKIHAHIDTNGIPTRIGNANQVRLLRVENGFIWATSTFLPYDYSDIRNIRDLCQSLIVKLDLLTDKYEQQCLPEIKKLDAGEYILNTNENETTLFTRESNILPPFDKLKITPI